MTFRNGTTYPHSAPEDLVTILESFRSLGERAPRLVFTYRDSDSVTGRVSRSTGTTKIPLVIHSRSSFGGFSLDVERVVRVELARGKDRLWSAPPAPADLATLDRLTDAEADNLRAQRRAGEVPEDQPLRWSDVADSWLQFPDDIRAQFGDPVAITAALTRVIACEGRQGLVVNAYQRA